MASRSRVLLLLLVGVSAITSCLDRVGGVSSNVAELQRRRWREKLPQLDMPQTLLSCLSPLSLTQMQSLAAGLKKNDASSFDAHQFCRSAGLRCGGDVDYRYQAGSACMHPEEEVAAHVFFEKGELRESGEIILPDLSPSKYIIPLLPTELAELMPPFSTVNVSEILKLLDMPREPNMSRNMADTLRICEGSEVEGEVKTCSTSVEGMVEFVVSLLGSDVDMFVDTSVVGSGQRVSVRKASRRENIVGSMAPVACHNFMFPYGVRYCHSVKGSDVFDLHLEVLQRGKKVARNATAVCHYLPDGAGGKMAACHPIYADMILWTPKPNTG